MTFIKLGEASEIVQSNLESWTANMIGAEGSLSDPEILERFQKFASNLKRIAPKADDFLYFSCAMMHSAEAAALNPDGSIKLTASGKPLEVGWNIKGDSWKWESNDPSVRPYKNSNGDIFPESELLKAYKNWVGKPLCVDHKSSSVDAIRGVIVDTYYDHKFKRVIALCALDKKNYPDLARKVQTGYSTSVSMGTAVTMAVCTDCGKAAKVADDFCQHMRNKSCYGEINVGLQPIELSIVVNGADPKAHIKHIIASANHINNYIATKETQLSKLSHADSDITDQLEDLKKDLALINDKIVELQSDINKEEEHAPYGMSSGKLQDDSSKDISTEDTDLAWPHARLASDELGLLKTALEHRFHKLEEKLEKILNKEDNNMSGNKDMNKVGYFQGAGGVNEPTPGQPKYEKDSMNETLRSDEDKQMVGQMDTGPVDQLHPGDLEKKKMLARANRRAEALEKAKANLVSNVKEAYFHGGGEGNEPTPGKPKYTKDPMAEKLRDKEDKQMVGQKPFPDVGDVDGLHPSPASVKEKSELERKKMLGRAALTAKFVKAANPDGSDNLGNSAWHIYRDEKLAFAASVNELTKGNAEALYDVVATKEYAKKLIAKIREHGFEKVASVYKSAQAANAMPPAEPGASQAAPAAPMPADAGTAAPAMPDMPAMEEEATEEEMVEDKGGDGDMKDKAMELATKVRDVSSDLLEAVRALAGEKAEMGDMEGLTATASKNGDLSTGKLLKTRADLNGALSTSMKKVVSELKEHESELKLIANIFDKDAVKAENEEFVSAIAEDAFKDATAAVNDAMTLMGAFVKYARGTQALLKKAEQEAAMEDENHVHDESCADDCSPTDDEHNYDMAKMDDEGMDDMDMEGLDGAEDKEVSDHTEEALLELLSDESSSDDENMADEMSMPTGTQVKTPDGKTWELKASAEPDLTTKEGRAQYRAKLAADMKFNPVLDEAHPKGGNSLGMKADGDLAKVEDLQEAHEAMMDVAKATPKVKKQAAEIQKLVSEGKIAKADIDLLVSHGVDADAVKYWKELYSDAGKEGSEFAAEMTKEHIKAKVAEEVGEFKVKVSRAYELAYDMVSRGLLAHERSAINSQVEEIMKWNDDAFDSMKRVVAKHTVSSLKKEAGRMPQVGLRSGEEVASSDQSADLLSELTQAFSNRKY